MDLLCDDVQREIVSHLDSISGIQNVSKHFKYIANTSKLYFDGHKNSTIFSLKVLRQYMLHNKDISLFKMPHAVEIDLVTDFNDYNAFDPELLKEALKQLFNFTNKKLRLVVNSFSWSLQGLPCFLSKLNKFESILFSGHNYYNINKDLVFSCKEVHIPGSLYAHIKFENVASLSLCLDYNINTEIALENISVRKAFNSQTTLNELFIYGPFLTCPIFSEFVISSQLLALKTLELHCQLPIWHYARTIQLCCPNLKNFKISASNLITSDLDYFDWNLWPQLKSLSLEDNFTLKDFKNWPSNLEHLNILDTGLQLLKQKNFETKKLKTLATSCSTSMRWKSFFKTMPDLEVLTLKMEHFVSGPQFKSRKNLCPADFWTSFNDIKHFNTLSVKFLERLWNKNLFKEEIQKYLNTEKIQFITLT